MTEAVPVRQRDLSVDIFRGLAVIFVVLGHANRGVLESGSPHAGLLRLLDWALYAAHMPAFFYMAGYFTYRSLRHASRSAYLTSRMSNVVKPYVIWSVLFYLLGLIMSYVTKINHPITFLELVEIGWQPIHVLWFLYVLLLLQLTATATKPYVVPALVAAVIIDAIISWSGLPRQMDVLDRFAVQAPFFLAGLVLADRGVPATGRLRRPGLFAAGAVALYVIGAAALYRAGVAEPVQFATIPLTALGILALAAGACAIDRHLSFAGSALARIGQASLAIYLLHIPVLAIVPRALRAVGLDDDAVRIAVGTVVGVGGSYLVFVLLTRLNLARPLGLR